LGKVLKGESIDKIKKKTGITGREIEHGLGRKKKKKKKQWLRADHIGDRRGGVVTGIRKEAVREGQTEEGGAVEAGKVLQGGVKVSEKKNKNQRRWQVQTKEKNSKATN